MIKENIKRLVYNQIKEILTVVYKNGDKKEINMSKSEYENMLSTGNFNFN